MGGGPFPIPLSLWSQSTGSPCIPDEGDILPDAGKPWNKQSLARGPTPWYGTNWGNPYALEKQQTFPLSDTVRTIRMMQF